MNKQRRSKIRNIMDQLELLKEQIEDIRDEEQDYIDNMPENFCGSYRYEKANEACDALDYAFESINDCIDNLDEAIE